jgi:hypothetical protein
MIAQCRPIDGINIENNYSQGVSFNGTPLCGTLFIQNNNIYPYILVYIISYLVTLKYIHTVLSLKYLFLTFISFSYDQ